MDVIWTSTIPPCRFCKAKGRPTKAAFHVVTILGETKDVCRQHAKDLPLMEGSCGLEYRDLRDAPRNDLQVVPLTEAHRWDYQTTHVAVQIVAAKNGRFAKLKEVSVWARASAEFHNVPLVFQDSVLWKPFPR